MDVVVLAWTVEESGGLVDGVDDELAALVDAGHAVRIVTRLGSTGPPVVPGAEVHAVPDAAPVDPPGFGDERLRALSFAGPALAVTNRRLRERSTAVLFAVGWQPTAVVTRVDRTAIGTVAVALAASDLHGRRRAATARRGAAAADVVLARTRRDRHLVAAALGRGGDAIGDHRPIGLVALLAAGPVGTARPYLHAAS